MVGFVAALRVGTDIAFRRHVARFTGPRRKRVRRLGTELPGLTAQTAETRPQPPGEPGDRRARRRRRESDYALRLVEKQKLRYNYGLTESQLRRYARQAAHAARGTLGRPRSHSSDSRSQRASDAAAS